VLQFGVNCNENQKTKNQRHDNLFMKKLTLLTGIIALAVSFSSQAQTIADWTFESSVPATAGPISPEIGAGQASGSHVGAAVYSSPAGDGGTVSVPSAHSYSANTWAVGDYWQFVVNTTGYNDDITLSYDHNGSGTGPGSFQLSYSLTGVNGSFTTLGSAYTLTPATVWSATGGLLPTVLNYDLSALTSDAVDNQASVYLRIIDTSTVSVNGGPIGTAGTDRVDNFDVENVAAVPEPSTVALFGMGGTVCLGFLRRFKK
jgi:hypothetical protein